MRTNVNCSICGYNTIYYATGYNMTNFICRFCNDREQKTALDRALQLRYKDKLEEPFEQFENWVED